MRLRFFRNAVWLVVAASMGTAPQAQAIAAERIVTGLTFPTFVTSAPGDPRLFATERAGRVMIVDNGQLLATPFLDLRDRVDAFNEGGLLSIAFPPGFSFSPGAFVYVYYSAPAATPGNTLALRVSRFQLLSGMEALRADATTEEILFEIEKIPGNHNGGTIAFRGDWLYLGLGDGGDAGDPDDNAQNDASQFGKILRFDVTAGPPWTVETWAKGLRNPYRLSFDRQTGDLYIGDVGQDALEEIDVQPAAALAGENFGWDVHEGSDCFDPDLGAEPPCDDSSLTFPVYEYSHLEAPAGNCGAGGVGSVTGGYVYRGSAAPEIEGHYFFGDFCTNEIWSFRWDGASGVSGAVINRSVELVPDVGDIRSIVSFGEDVAGELLIVDILDGEVFRVPEPKARDLACALLLGLVGFRPVTSFGVRSGNGARGRSR